jgi:hypothetical protein
MSDLWDAIEGKYDKSIPFWTVFYVTENGETRSVEIQAGTAEGAIRKAHLHYPNSERALVSLP